MPRFGWSFGFGLLVAVVSGHAFGQGAPAEPGKGAPSARPPAPPTAKPAAPAPSSAAKVSAPAPATATATATRTTAPARTAASSPAPAASAPAAPASAVAPGAFVLGSAPDIVRLRNGGLLRGTISELAPGDSVTMVLITGEIRKLPFVEVLYAGAANAEAGAPSPSVGAAAPPAVAPAVGTFPANKFAETQPFAVVHAKESVLNVVSKQNGLTLFRRAASSEGVSVNASVTVTGYAEVCTAPCNVSMPAGSHTFAVAKPGGKPHEADAVVLPAGKATMAIATVDRTAIRAGVGLVGVVGLISGFALVLSDSGNGSGSGDVVGPAVLAGLGAGAIGLAFAISDGATVSVTADPSANNTAANRSTAWLDNRNRDVSSLRRSSGLALNVRF